MIKKIAFSFLFFIVISTFGQKLDVNNYKYVIVPDRFDFLKSEDQYQTSSLTKFLLKKKGFVVYLSNEKLPEELMLNRCKALIANVIDDSSMFTVKSKIELKDCSDRLVYASEIGKSKEKDYKKSYQEAIRNAFKDPIVRNYSYTEKTINPATTPKVITKIVAAKKVSTAQNILYAQATSNGFQLVDTTPKVIFSIMKTQQNTVFIIKDKNGILYQKDSNWIAEYYENNVLIKKIYQVKF